MIDIANEKLIKDGAEPIAPECTIEDFMKVDLRIATVVTAQKVEGAERWAANYGAFGIFASRLLPVVRHLIGIPAGIVRMDYVNFSIYTLLGSAIWSAVLCWLGVKVGADITKGEMHKVTFWLLGFLLAVGAMYYFFVHRHMTGKPEIRNPESEDPSSKL